MNHRLNVFWEMHKIMIICTILFVAIFSVVNIFNVFNLSDGIKNIVELISIILAIYNADKSRINANDSRDSASKSKNNAEYVRQLKEKAISQALNIEKTREKEKVLYAKLSRDKQKILSKIDKALIFLDSDEDKAEDFNLGFISLSKEFQRNIQDIGGFINYFELVLDKEVVACYTSIDNLIKTFLEFDRIKKDNDESWSKSEIFQLRENLSNMKVHVSNIDSI